MTTDIDSYVIDNRVEEFVYMTEGGYSREEILKGERIMLSVSTSSTYSLSISQSLTVRCRAVSRIQHLFLLLALLLGSTNLESRRLRYPNSNSFEVPHGSYPSRSSILESET